MTVFSNLIYRILKLTKLFNFFQSSMFDPTSYRSVHNLATNTDKRHFEDLIKKTAEAVFMAKVFIDYLELQFSWKRYLLPFQFRLNCNFHGKSNCRFYGSGNIKSNCTISWFNSFIVSWKTGASKNKPLKNVYVNLYYWQMSFKIKLVWLFSFKV